MGFLSEVLGRPANEKPFLLLPVGFPAAGAEVPQIAKKALCETAIFIE
jgi:iodotyrosine deiodinase